MTDDLRIRATDGSAVFVTVTDGAGPSADRISDQVVTAIDDQFDDRDDIIVERRS